MLAAAAVKVLCNAVVQETLLWIQEKQRRVGSTATRVSLLRSWCEDRVILNMTKIKHIYVRPQTYTGSLPPCSSKSIGFHSPPPMVTGSLLAARAQYK